MSQAWLLDVGANSRVAVGGRELVHLLYEPQSYLVPMTPRHVRRVVSWQERLLPLVDLASWLGDRRPQTELKVVGVFAYQFHPGEEPQYGALRLAAPPTRLAVGDDQACDFPEPTSAWESVAISCFEHEGERFPILDLRRVYGTALAPSHGKSTSATRLAVGALR